MATKAATDPDDVDDQLDTVDKTLERLRTMYEQYFLGIQKQAPTFIHNDVERKLRDLTQLQLRNTGLRYRLATLQQKFGSYNSYWRRTLRQIEQGTYFRNLSKVGREAIRTGADIPEEILAAMPKRMREQVVRDREQALAIARRRDEERQEAEPDLIATIGEPTELRRNLKTATGAHIVEESDSDLDLEAFFASVEEEKDPQPPASAPLRAASITTPPAMRSGRSTGPIQTQTQPRQPAPRPSGPVQIQTQRVTGPMQAVTPPASTRSTGPVHVVARQTAPMPAVAPPTRTTGAVPVVPAPARTTGAVPVVPPARTTGAVPVVPPARTTGAVPVVPSPARTTGAVPVVPSPARTTGAVPVVPAPARTTGAVPVVPSPARTTGAVPVVPPAPPQRSTGGIPRVPAPAGTPPNTKAPSQVTRPTPIVPGAAAAKGPVPVESMSGPFPRAPTPKPAPAAPQKPPPGMSDADVNALYAKYVQAKEMVGEKVGPGEHGKLLKTINAQAPKIMEQYKAKAVDFSVVVKDNQVIIRAKPKT